MIEQPPQLHQPPQLQLNHANTSDDFFKLAHVDNQSEPSFFESPNSNTPQIIGESLQDPYNPNSPAYKRYKVSARVFFGISFVSALLILTLQGYIYAVINIHKNKIQYEPKYQEISIYLALFIFAAVFQVGITVIGLMTRNLLLLSILCCFYACMLIYTGIQYHELKEFVGDILQGGWKLATKATSIASICTLAATLVSQVLMIYLYLRKYVNWFKFKNIGGDLRIKRYYNIFQIHRSLLIFSFFFFVGFTIQFLIIMVENKRSTEFILTVCVIPLTIIVLIASDLGISKEWLWVSVPCVLIYLGAIAYVLFKIIRLFTKYTSAYDISLTPGDYFPGRSSLITFGVITIVFLLSIIISEIALMTNFHKGLKSIIGNPRYLRRQQVDEDEQLSIS